MKIDLDALRKIAAGDPNSKVAVRRGWLAQVLTELETDSQQPPSAYGKFGATLDHIADILTGKKAA